MGRDSKSLKGRTEGLEASFVGARPQVLLANLEGIGRARFEVLGVLGGLLESPTFIFRMHRYSVRIDGTLLQTGDYYDIYILDGSIVSFRKSEDDNGPAPDGFPEDAPIHEYLPLGG